MRNGEPKTHQLKALDASRNYISRICTDFLEFHGDRRFADDPAIVGGFARIDGIPVMVIGTQKGRNVKENVFRNFGCPNPEGYRKALRLMRDCSNTVSSTRTS